MVQRVFSFSCVRCGVGRLTSEKDRKYCTDLCEKKHIYEKQRLALAKNPRQKELAEKALEEKPVKYCLCCTLAFTKLRKGKDDRFCSEPCERRFNRANAPVDNTKVKKKRAKPKYNMAQLVKISEYNRLYDNFHITRQIRGYK